MTVTDFYWQYVRLSSSADLGVGTKTAYEFLSATLYHASFYEARQVVQARLVALGRDANRTRGRKQNDVLDQIAILEHFLEEIKGR